MKGADYRKSLEDGRRVFLDGQRVLHLTEHPLLRVGVDWVSESYEQAAATRGTLGLPRNRDELRAFSERLLGSDTTLASTAGCLALEALLPELRAAHADSARAIESFLSRCREGDLRATVARDVFARDLRVVERRADGIVVRGSKLGVAGAALVHELLVLPAGRAGEASLAFTVPVAAPGIRLVCTSTAPREKDTRHYPLARRFSVPESVVLFEDVFVPKERILLDGDDALAARFREAVGVWERARSAAQLADRADLLMGLAQTVTEMNGVPDEANIVEKLSAIAVYATMCRAGWEAAISSARTGAAGVCLPDESFVYATLHHATHLYHEMVAYLHDAAGGLVITCPSVADYENAEVGSYVEKYVRTMDGVSGNDRMRVFHLIRDLTADAYGGWLKVSSQSVAGGMHAQRLAAHAHYDLDRARARVRQVAQLG
ncbi:MAG TPA: 4-hydroxyphenylacetate 3-hydroxylase C-terminal domain-containing protein [Myxococcota bacterium]|nr:4-hydroxyphenylacetate 3-hydroxylase C-terminal domain-containing protein [Myxococcota bacterium]